MKSLATLALLAGVAFAPASVWGQGRLQQGFETSDVNSGDELRYTNTGGTLYSGTFGSVETSNNAAPKTDNVYSEGTSSLGVINNTGGGTTTSSVEFTRVAFTSTTGNYLSFRMGSFQTNNNGGIDNATTSNGVTVSIAYNGSSTFVPTLKVIGVNNGSVYSFNATGSYTNPSPINTTTPTLITVTSPNSLTTGISSLRLNFGPSITSVQVRITLEANGKTAIFLDDVIVGSDGPLPVELTSFSAATASIGAELRWSTAMEKNNDRFEVQRSTNGSEYFTVGQVAGQGSTTQAQQYRYHDKTPLSGLTYYRLRQVDKDGTAAFSEVVTLRPGKRISQPYPNPTTVSLFMANDGSFRIFDATGRTLKQGQATAGSSVDVQNILPGTYYVEVKTKEGREVFPFVKASN